MKQAGSISPEKARLRDSTSRRWSSANSGSRTITARLARSNHSQRSRSARSKYSHLKSQSNQPMRLAAGRLGPPQHHQQHRQRHRAGVIGGAQPRLPPALAAVMLAHRLGREAQQAERAPAEGVGEKDDEADRHEQDRAQLRLAQPAEPQPQPEGDQRQRHRQSEIDEAEQEGMAERQRQREGDRRRQAVVHLARDPQHSRHGHRRDRHHDQLGRQLDPDQLGKRDRQQVDPEIADRQPAKAIPLRQIRAGRAVGGDLEPPHVPGQVDQRRERR